jgi:hypothetical protein
MFASSLHEPLAGLRVATTDVFELQLMQKCSEENCCTHRDRGERRCESFLANGYCHDNPDGPQF